MPCFHKAMIIIHNNITFYKQFTLFCTRYDFIKTKNKINLSKINETFEGKLITEQRHANKLLEGNI